MNISTLVSTLLSTTGLLLGITYIVGGVIVNLHLSRFGITQYQVIRVKYLAVGLTYLTNFIAILLLSAIPAIFLLTLPFLLQQIFMVISLLASVSLLWLWGTQSRFKPFFYSWRFWVILGALSSIFPLAILVRSALALTLLGTIRYELAITGFEAILAGFLSFIGQTYFFARHLYGRSNTVFGSIDPIGMGIPVRVQLAGETAKISLLKKLGVPALLPEVTDTVLLLDETDKHYIVGISQENEIQAVEVAKELIAAIRYYGHDSS